MFKKEEYVGEVYCVDRSTTCGLLFGITHSFRKFKKSDISDYCGDKVKIFGVWEDRKDIFYYDDIYKALRETIINRNRK